MGGINVSRWLLGGLVAGAVIWLMEGAASKLYMDQMQEAMEARGLSMDMGAGVWMTSVLVGVIVGLGLVFFYAACRPRFGPGPRTAIMVAVAMFVVGYLVSLLGYQMLGLFPNDLLVKWGALGLIETIIASLAGGWVYREA